MSSSTSLPILTTITGEILGSNGMTIGSSASSGRSSSAIVSAFRRSISAWSRSVPQENSVVTSDTLEEELDSMCSTPLTRATASSMGSETSVSTSSGPAPGITVSTMMLFRDISGKKSSPSRLNPYPPRPAISMKTIRKVVFLLTAISGSLITVPLPSRRRTPDAVPQPVPCHRRRDLKRSLQIRCS